MSHSFEHLLSLVPDEIRDKFNQNLLNYYLSLTPEKREEFIQGSRNVIEEINIKRKNLSNEEKEILFLNKIN